METKRGRVITYNEELPLIESNDPSTVWSALDQWPPNMAIW